MLTAKSVTTAQLSSLLACSGDDYEIEMAATASLAIDGSFDAADWSALSSSAARRIGNMSQDEAIEACVQELNDIRAREGR